MEPKNYKKSTKHFNQYIEEIAMPDFKAQQYVSNNIIHNIQFPILSYLRYVRVCCCHMIRPTLLKVRLKFIFAPLLEHKRTYSCVVLGVGKLSYYPASIINGKREFYIKSSLVTVYQFFNC